MYGKLLLIYLNLNLMSETKNKRKKLRFWAFYHAGLLIFSILMAMLMKYFQTGNALHPTTVVAASSLFIMSVGIGYIAIGMIRKAENYNQKQLKKKMIPALLLFYLFSFLVANLAVSLGVFAWFLYNKIDLSGFWTHLFWKELNFASGQFFLWLMFFTIAFFYILWRKSVDREQKLREENLVSRYNQLKSQVNPHFLFNSLNTLSELVYVDARKADNYTRQLSEVYRYVLENEEVESVSLQKELDFVKKYFILQEERDKDKIRLEVDFPDPVQYRVLPVSLQTLVENAIKHNAASRENPLNIRIFKSDSFVAVANSLNRKSRLGDSGQTGLSNLKERIRLITGKEMEISENKGEYIVRLPLMKESK